MKIKVLLFFILSSYLTSCAPYRLLEDERALRSKAELDRSQMKTQYDQVKKRLDSIQISQVDLMKINNQLKADTAMVRQSLNEYIKLDAQNKLRMDQLSKTTDRILDANLSENERLLSRVKEQKDDLEKQKMALERKIDDFERTKAEYNAAQSALAEKDYKIRELQTTLENHKRQLDDIKTKVSNALAGFKANGLDVVNKNGKVYVLMPESLLFKSGSKVVDVKGQDALRQLTHVLNANPDINITVEGHTDNVPYKPKSTGSLVDDNWDLSVVRATSVVKVMTGYGLSPTRIAAQGKGEYVPINTADTKEARAINRRTEIILVPNVDEALKTLE